MAKHFQISIGDDTFSFAKNHLGIAAEAAVDGIYVVRTNLPAAQFDAVATVRAYTKVSEHAFRALTPRTSPYLCACSPRACGDEPSMKIRVGSSISCSPRLRG